MLMSAENGASMDLTGGMSDLHAVRRADLEVKTERCQVRPRPQRTRVKDWRTGNI